MGDFKAEVDKKSVLIEFKHIVIDQILLLFT